jgi:hypothetical protein
MYHIGCRLGSLVEDADMSSHINQINNQYLNQINKYLLNLIQRSLGSTPYKCAWQNGRWRASLQDHNHNLQGNKARQASSAMWVAGFAVDSSDNDATLHSEDTGGC